MEQAGALAFFADGGGPPGTAVAGVLAHDWAESPLGAIGQWPGQLACVACWVLESPLPAALVWGEARTTIVNDALRSVLGDSGQGTTLATAFAVIECDVLPAAMRAFSGRASLIEDCRLTVDRHGFCEEAWFTFSCSPVRGADGTVPGIIVTGMETTPGVEARRRSATVAAELGHRLKNSMAMVQAIAVQSLRRVAERGLVESFTERIAALGRAHDVLLRDQWERTPVASVVADTLGIYGVGDGTAPGTGRIVASGPDLLLGARAMLATAMLLHELATNAVKYGALSVETGRVAIVWRIDGDELVLDWAETGGPPATPPTRAGFGSRLINMGMVGTGHVQKRYEPAGFSVTFRAPLRQLLEN